MEELKLVYVENVDGVYSAYASKSDPYVATTNLKEAKLDRWIAESLIRTTAEIQRITKTALQSVQRLTTNHTIGLQISKNMV